MEGIPNKSINFDAIELQLADMEKKVRVAAEQANLAKNNALKGKIDEREKLIAKSKELSEFIKNSREKLASLRKTAQNLLHNSEISSGIEDLENSVNYAEKTLVDVNKSIDTITGTVEDTKETVTIVNKESGKEEQVPALHHTDTDVLDHLEEDATKEEQSREAKKEISNALVRLLGIVVQEDSIDKKRQDLERTKNRINYELACEYGDNYVNYDTELKKLYELRKDYKWQFWAFKRKAEIEERIANVESARMKSRRIQEELDTLQRKRSALNIEKMELVKKIEDKILELGPEAKAKLREELIELKTKYPKFNKTFNINW